MITAITAFLKALEQGLSCMETKIGKQCETDVLKTKKKMEKKSNSQEDLILDMIKLLLKYQPSMTKTDKMRVKSYIQRIKRTN